MKSRAEQVDRRTYLNLVMFGVHKRSELEKRRQNKKTGSHVTTRGTTDSDEVTIPAGRHQAGPWRWRWSGPAEGQRSGCQRECTAHTPPGHLSALQSHEMTMWVNATEVKVMKAGPHQTQSYRSASELLSLTTEHWNKNHLLLDWTAWLLEMTDFHFSCSHVGRQCHQCRLTPTLFPQQLMSMVGHKNLIWSLANNYARRSEKQIWFAGRHKQPAVTPATEAERFNGALIPI